MVISIITIAVWVLGLLVSRLLYKKRKVKGRLNVRGRFLYGLWHFLSAAIALNICLYQFPAGRSIQEYLVKNAAFLVAIFSFSMQQVLGDVIGGMIVAIAKPYDIGERITIESKGVTGIVEDISIRDTVIKCYDNTRLVVPNSVINKEILRNTNYADCLCGNFVEVTVSYESDIKKAIAIMEKVIYDHPLSLFRGKKEGVKKELDVQAYKLGKDGIGLKAIVWTTDTDTNFTACSEIRQKIAKKFKEENIQITG